MKIEFQIDFSRFTLGDYCTLEDAHEDPASVEMRQIRNLLAGQMVDEKGAPVDPIKARKMLSALTMEQLSESQAAFFAKIQEMRQALIPPTSGGA